MHWRRFAIFWMICGSVLGPSTPASGSLFPWGGRDTALRELRDINRQVLKADEHWASDERDAALADYRAALQRYQVFQVRHPETETAMIRFRSTYCENQIGQLERNASTANPPAADESAASPTSETSVIAEPVAVIAEPVVAVPPPPPTDPASSPPDRTPPGEALDAESLLRLGARAHRLRLTGRLGEARTLLQSHLSRMPDESRLYLWLATVMIDEGEYEDALIVLTDMPDDARNQEAHALLLAAVRYGMGEPFEALVALDRALVARPDSAQAYMNLARLRFQMDPQANAHEAEAYYRFAVRLGAARDSRFETRMGLRWE